jgi:transposase
MKNRYLKGAHISEKKVRELLKLFSEDLTATQIANISGISRITVNAYLKMIRTHIAAFNHENYPEQRNGKSVAYPALNGHCIDDSVKKSLYGIYKHGDVIITEKLSGLEDSWVHDWVRGKSLPEAAILEKHNLNKFQGIADFNAIKLIRVNTPPSGLNKGRSSIDEIDMFWGMLKSRLVKFRGLNCSTLYLHVKETEFRYNYRNEDIYSLLVNIIQRKPLHFSKPV